MCCAPFSLVPYTDDREDAEQTDEQQHQESGQGMQLHCEAAGRFGVHLHDSGQWGPAFPVSQITLCCRACYWRATGWWSGRFRLLFPVSLPVILLLTEHILIKGAVIQLHKHFSVCFAFIARRLSSMGCRCFFRQRRCLCVDIMTACGGALRSTFNGYSLALFWISNRRGK